MNPTFASFLTPEGVVVAGTITTGLIAVLKTTFPVLDARISGALMAFVITAVLYVLTAIAVPPVNPDGYLTVFAAWLSCATTAVGIHSAVTHVQAVAK